MNKLLNSLVTQLETRSRRERFMLLAALALVPWLAVRGLVLHPVGQVRERIGAEVVATRQYLDDLAAKRDRLRAERLAGRVREADPRLAGYRQEMAGLERQVAQAVGKLVAPREMTVALESLLREHRGLTLLGLETLPRETVRLTAETAPHPPARPEAAKAKAAAPKTTTGNARKAAPEAAAEAAAEAAPEPAQVAERLLYRHSLKLVFEGDYLNTLGFLKSLGTMPWTLYWDSLTLRVREHPRMQVVLIIHTLSLNEELIGA
ncbi:MAG: hypothetical protein HQL82_04465 [Magnetococcales bacterium]|nr:hypothetical protein [Magnetococcales bacterium]